MWSLLYVFGALVLAGVTFAPVTNLRHWLVRGNDFPRLQYSAAIVLMLVVGATWQGSPTAPSPVWMALLVAALGYQLYWIWPYCTAHRHEVRTASSVDIAERPSIRMLTSNVLMENRDSAALIEHVLDLRPDLLVTLESDAWWQERLDAALTDWPHRVACPLDNRYGMHLYSRLPLDEAHVDYLVDDEIPSISARFELDGLPIRFHAIHPTPPAPGESPDSVDRDIELLTLADSLHDSDERIIVTGDLNDVAWSRTTRLFRQRSRLLDPRVGRGMFNTFHADWWCFRWPLDHFFVSGHFVMVSMHRLSNIGSDHFPVFVELRLLASEDQVPHLDHELDTELEEDTRRSAEGRQVTPPSVRTRKGPNGAGAIAARRTSPA